MTLYLPFNGPLGFLVRIFFSIPIEHPSPLFWYQNFLQTIAESAPNPIVARALYRNSGLSLHRSHGKKSIAICAVER